VDGKTLTEAEKLKLCDMDAVRLAPWWLNDGAIGCALSHRRALGKFLETGAACAFIVEDDVVLPGNIEEVLNDLEPGMREDEVVLLYYASHEPIELSSHNQEATPNGMLHYPVNLQKILTATAYVIGRQAAQRMYEAILPVRVTADSWFHFYQLDCFRHFRLLYPMMVQVHHFKSSIDYIHQESRLARLTNWIDRHKVPLLFQLLRYRRKQMLNRMLKVYVSDRRPMTEVNL
jgi:glycosyl transferase family 25